MPHEGQGMDPFEEEAKKFNTQMKEKRQDEYPQEGNDMQAEEASSGFSQFDVNVPLMEQSFEDLIRGTEELMATEQDPKRVEEYQMLIDMFKQGIVARDRQMEEDARRRENANTQTDLQSFEEVQPMVEEEGDTPYDRSNRDPMKERIHFDADQTRSVLKEVIAQIDDPEIKARYETQLALLEQGNKDEDASQEKSGLPPKERLRKLQESYTQNKDNMSDKERGAFLLAIDKLQEQLGPDSR
ncbi:hypothetical protein KKH43_00800 [Patescibacteria group bacterium]|nr:hypothetical protein [Patescibacteria group bacterium]